MAYFNDKVKVPVPGDGRHKMDLSAQHITTSDFFLASPVYARECVPNDDLSVNVETFARMAPLQVPAFARCSINNRGFFVPFRTVWRGFTRFITDSPTATSTTPVVDTSVPTVRNYRLIDAIFGFGADEGRWVTAGTSSSYDFILENAYGSLGLNYPQLTTTGTTYWKFTAEGKQVWKVLRSLGYFVQWYYPSSNDIATGKYNTYSMLPLMCYAKVIMDWYYPSAYAGQNADYAAVEYWLRQDKSFDWQGDNVARIFKLMTMVNYDADYFVSQWDNPVAPSDYTYSAISIPDITENSTGSISNITYKGKVTNSSAGMYPSNSAVTNGTPVISRIPAGTPSGSSTQFVTNFTQYLDTALHKLTDYMRRHQLTSIRPLDRYLTDWGIGLSAEKLERSVYLGSDVIDFQIGDVMSTASTSTAEIGEYKGKGAAYGGKTLEYKTDEFGMFIIVSSIVPKIAYVQGIRRHVMHVGKTDFFNKTFDSLGTQATSSQELYMSVDGGNTYNKTNRFNDEVFGFIPRYAEYASGHQQDALTGDFDLLSIGLSMQPWHTDRMFTDSIFPTAADVHHSQAFVSGSFDGGQYERIFQVPGGTVTNNPDHFYMIYNFNVGLVTDKKPLWDSYDFSDVCDNPKYITTDIGGVKMN